MERGFRAEILTGPFHAPNGGLSAQVQRVTIVGLDVPEDCRIAAPSKDAPAVVLGETAPGYRVLRPAGGRLPGTVGWMASGAYVHSSDSRWRDVAGTKLPLPLHDRTETVADYNTTD